MPDEARSGWPGRVAVAFWIDATGEIVDGYPDEDVWSLERLDSDAASFEIRMAPIFEDGRS